MSRRKSHTAAQIREDIRLWADEQTKIMQVYEIMWQARWAAARNPFEAWADWMSPSFKASRKKINDPYIAAIRARDDLNKGRRHA